MTVKDNPYLFNLSIVIPVFNSENALVQLMEEITQALAPNNLKFETIFVNDCSQDSSALSLENIFSEHANISIIELRKNAGQDNAIMAGLKYASGQHIVVMDDDLQHDPKYIPALLSELNDEVDVCYANFLIKKQNFYKNLGSKFADFCANILMNKPKNIYLSPFKIFNAHVASEIIKYDGPYPYIDGLIFRVTRKITQIDVNHSQRLHGQGNYTLVKSIKVWANLVTNFSILPLRLSTFFGFVTAVFGFLLGGFYIVTYFYSNQLPPGWSSIIVLILVFGGIQLIALGLIGEYLGRLFLLNNKEPQFIIKNMKTNKKT
ncbi:glycosyltransferase family 2 protein [Gammaproteobacteria bacterium]|jgi:polyisoprenyl-phosphate glycosyltransferase|nr:glycosyltransferase family 2 protein [Gammaproteobacteria bacterium]MDC0892089.1 glycosyltransferase family 2 protein [Gammaproteobacteria bacterium]